MNARVISTPTGIVAALGFMGAVVLGWQLTGKPAVSTDSAATLIKTRAASRSDAGRPIWLADKIGKIRQEDSFAQRMRLTIALANSIPDSDIFAWLQRGWFDLGDGFETRLFTRILTDRLDPVAMARLHLLGRNAWQATAELLSLAASDPQQVLALFRENPNDMAELKVLAEMAKTHPALALQRFLELSAFGIPEGESYDPRGVIEALAEADPAALEAALGKMGAWQYHANEALVGHRLATSFDEEIQKLYARPDGWRMFQTHMGSPEILAKLLKNPADLPSSWRNEIAKVNYWGGGGGDPSVAEFWWNTDLNAAGFTEDQARRIRKVALSGIAANDPGKALPLLDTVEPSVADRKEFIQDIFARTLSDSQTAALLELLKSDVDLQAAQEQLARKNGDTHAPLPQVDKPDQWLADFADLEPGSDANRNYRNMLSKWNDDQLADLNRQFQNLPDARKLIISEKIVMDDFNYVRGKNIYGAAIQHLAATPEQHPEIIAKATNYALQWSCNDPVAAADWVNGLPAGETREWVQKNLATQWSSVDPAAADRWVGSLPKAEQSKLRNSLKEKPAK